MRITAALLPTAVSFFVTYGLVQQLPPHEAGIPTTLWWIGLFAIGTVVLVATDKVARRLLPLVALFKLSLVFPDQAPSRYAIAMKTGTTKQLERRINELKRDGIPNDEAQFATIMLELVASLSVHDRMTRGHCERVRAYTDLIIAEMGIHEPDASRLRWAALLHDVGKLFVNPDILNSPDRPTNAQWEELKSHTWQGDKLIGPLKPWLGSWHRAVGEHHERWDGGGYPNGLAGIDIHLGARIVAVADAFDVMTSTRSYKKPIPAEEARAEIARCAGGQFDPQVVRAFLNIGLGHLRLAIGPLAWLANFPAAGQAGLAPSLSPVVTGATAAATVVVATVSGGFGGAFVPDEGPPQALAMVEVQDGDQPAFESPTTTTIVVTTTAPPTTTPTTTSEEPAAPSTTAAGTTPPPDTQASTARPTTTQPPATQPGNTQAPTTQAPTTQPTTTQPRRPEAPPPDPPPDAYALAGSVVEDGGAVPLTLTATAASDLSWRIAAAPVRGTAILTPPTPAGTEFDTPVAQFGTVAYEPAPDQSGTDEMTFEVCDPERRCDTGVVTITIAPTPDAPVASTDSLPAATEDTVTDLASTLFLLNDSDADQEPLTINSVEALGSGSAVLLPGGTAVRYVPAADDDTEDTLRYEACDPTGRCDTALALLDIIPAPDHPRPLPDSALTTEDSPVTIPLATLLANDSDPDGEALEVRSATTARGTAIVDALNSSLTFTPQANDDTEQIVLYEVCDPTDRCSIGTLTVDITAVVDRPEPSPDTASTLEDTVLTLALANLTANDNHDENKAMTVDAVVLAAGQGSATIVGNDLRYEPAANDDSEATIDYTVCDSDDECAVGVLTIDIIAVNDPPAVDPIADRDADLGDVLDFFVSASDVEGNAIRFEATGLPSGIAINETTGRITGTLTAAAAGESLISVTATETSQNGEVSEPTTFELDVDFGNVSPLTQSLIISEVLYRSSPGVYDEFIEITNIGESPVSLTGIQLLDHDPGGPSSLGWRRTLGATDSRGAASMLAVGQTAVIWVDNPLQAGRSFPDAPAGSLSYRGPSNSQVFYLGAFAEGGEDLWLVDASDDVIDYVATGVYPGGFSNQVVTPAPAHHWTGTVPSDLVSAAAGQSISLAVPGRNDQPGCWERTGSGDAVGRCTGATQTVQDNVVPGDTRVASIGRANFI